MASSAPRPCQPTAASSTTSSSSSVVVLTAEDLLDTAASATADSRSRWPEASRTKSTLVVSSLHSSMYSIPEHYTLLNAKDWVACDAPPEGYNVICAYAAAFQAGMRLPLQDLHAAVLRHYGLAPSQLMPNAWRYLSAFVLLCEDAGVQPMLPLFLSFFVICAEKGKSTGRYHFKPCRYPLPDSGSGRRRRRRGLFTGKMPQPMWKDRFFFIQGPSWLPWPCSMEWGTPSMVSIEAPALTNDTMGDIHKLLRLVGDTGIDIMKFLKGRNPPVGHLQVPAAATPLCAAVKQEANSAAAVAAAALTTTERKSPERVTSLHPLSLQTGFGSGYAAHSTESPPAPAGVGLGHGEVGRAASSIDLMSFLSGSCLPVGSWSEPTPRRKRAKSLEICSQQQQRNAGMENQWTESLPAPAGVGLGHGEPSITGGEHSCFGNLLHYFTQEALAQFNGKEQELHMAKVQYEADIAQVKQALVEAKAEASGYAEELQKVKAEASRYAEELQKAAIQHAEELQKQVQDAYDKGARDTTKWMQSLLSGSSPPPGLGLAPQAPVDDQ